MQVPQVRDRVGEGSHRSELMTFLRGNSDVLNRLAAEMYARGISVRDIEDALQDATGEPLLSRNVVRGLSETLWEDYQAFCERDLSTFAASTCSSTPSMKACASGAAARACSVRGRSAAMGAR